MIVCRFYPRLFFSEPDADELEDWSVVDDVEDNSEDTIPKRFSRLYRVIQKFCDIL